MLTEGQMCAIAEAANQLAYDTCSEIPKEQEPDYTRADLERLAMAALLTHAPAAPVIVGNLYPEAIWRYNFMAGWRHADMDGNGFDDPKITLPARETSAFSLLMRSDGGELP